MNLYAQFKGGVGDGYSMASLKINNSEKHIRISNSIISSNDAFQIFKLDNIEEFVIEVINAEGKVIFQKNNNLQIHSFIKILPKGIYFLSVSGKNWRQTEKFIKI